MGEDVLMSKNVSLMKNVSIFNVSEDKIIYFGLNKTAYQGVLSGLCILAAVSIINNVAVLVASKFTTAGQSATLVFIRSLCIADVVTGLFGIFKAILLNHLDSIMINCFLPESLFVSASTTLSLTLLWLNCDSYLRVMKPLSYGTKMDKSNIINAMMLLWNFAFIVGFMPQMGWSRDDYSCDFFNYYDDAYLRLICSIWILCMIFSCFLQYKLQKVRQQVLKGSHFLSPDSQEFKKFSKLIVTIRIDIIIWILTYLPLLVYLLIYCDSCSLGGTQTANVNLFFFIPIFLIRSFISAFIHSYRTIKIQHAMRSISRRLSNAIPHKGSLCSVEGGSSNGSSNSNQSDPTINTVSRTTTKLGIRAHKRLEATSSNVTIDSTIEELPVGHNSVSFDHSKGNNSLEMSSFEQEELSSGKVVKSQKCPFHDNIPYLNPKTEINYVEKYFTKHCLNNSKHAKGNHFTKAEVEIYPKSLQTDCTTKTNISPKHNVHNENSKSRLMEHSYFHAHSNSVGLYSDNTSVSHEKAKLQSKHHKRLQRSRNVIEGYYNPLASTLSEVDSDPVIENTLTHLEVKDKQENGHSEQLTSTSTYLEIKHGQENCHSEQLTTTSTDLVIKDGQKNSPSEQLTTTSTDLVIKDGLENSNSEQFTTTSEDIQENSHSEHLTTSLVPLELESRLENSHLDHLTTSTYLELEDRQENSHSEELTTTL